MKRFLCLTIGLLTIVNIQVSAQTKQSKTDYAQYVNPFIGTGSIDSLSLSGSNFPGPVMPFGLVQLSPDTQESPEDPCSGYDYADDTIVGFSHTHLSGTGVADLFDFMFMPYRGDVRWTAGKSRNGAPGFSSSFDHATESASPGYYGVELNDAEMKVELTATDHCGVQKYTSLNSDPYHVIIDLDHSLDKKRPYWSCKILDAQIRVIDNHTIEGYRMLTGWADVRKVYFRAEFSKPFSSHLIKAGHRIYKNVPVGNHKDLKMVVNFEDQGSEALIINLGLSSVSYEGARENLKAEISAFNFAGVKEKARLAWNKELSTIDVKGSDDQKRIFYSSLYHTFIHPSNIADVNGDYINSNGEKMNAPDKKNYSTFSLWDTYRAAHPLYTLVQEKRTGEFINSMLRQYTDYGYLPIWQLWGQETYCMIGNHAIPVIVDAFMKGIEGFDYKLAYEAIKASSTVPHGNSTLTLLDQYHYIPENIESQSVSVALETAFNDWCVAQMALEMGEKEDYEYFINRAGYYKNHFDSSIGFFRAKNSDGEWISPFSPLKYGGNGGYPFTEGNGWQYLFYVPQDVYGFIDLMGGNDAFCQKLDTLFTLQAKPGDVNGNASGFIGQYAHGNEPSHHIAYLYNYTDEPWKAQYYSAKIINEFYSNTPAGYSGNEDAGQMSAWYVFSAMGFYPVNPSNSIYCFGSPQLPEATINFESGKQFKVKVQNAGGENIYIQKIILNGEKYQKNYIRHRDLVEGGTLEFIMGKKPNKKMAKYEKPVE